MQLGETIRGLAGKLLISKYQNQASNTFLPTQLGVGVRGGAEALIHKTRQWLAGAPINHGLLQLDFRNAFNSVSRLHLLQAVEKHCPLFTHYAIFHPCRYAWKPRTWTSHSQTNGLRSSGILCPVSPLQLVLAPLASELACFRTSSASVAVPGPYSRLLPHLSYSVLLGNFRKAKPPCSARRSYYH